MAVNFQGVNQQQMKPRRRKSGLGSFALTAGGTVALGAVGNQVLKSKLLKQEEQQALLNANATITQNLGKLFKKVSRQEAFKSIKSAINKDVVKPKMKKIGCAVGSYGAAIFLVSGIIALYARSKAKKMQKAMQAQQMQMIQMLQSMESFQGQGAAQEAPKETDKTPVAPAQGKQAHGQKEAPAKA